MSVTRLSWAYLKASRVYIHFRDEANRQLATEVQVRLRERGFQTPGVERQSRNDKNEVHYFHKEDGELAEYVKEIVQSFLDISDKPQDVYPSDLSRDFPGVREKQLEVWLDLTR